jgi:capsule polysaccharide export protein KpsE/RkpR
MAKLTERDQELLDVIRNHPEILEDASLRERFAAKMGVTERALKDRIEELKNLGFFDMHSGAPDEQRDRENDTRKMKELEHHLHALWTRRKLLIRNFIIIFIVSAIFALVMPKTYRSTSVIMPPAPQQDLGLLSSLMNNLPLSGFSIGQNELESQTFLAILSSRTVMEDVIGKFDLIEFYDAKNLEKAVEELRSNSYFDIEDEGTITVVVDISTGWFSGKQQDDRIKQFVQDITNYFVVDLDSVNKRLKTEQARFQRLFIEKRYQENIEDLRIAEDSLKAFQEKNKMIALPEQTEAAIKAGAVVKAQILDAEVRLGIMEKLFSPTYPEIGRVKSEIAELESRLREMEAGSDEGSLFPGFKEVPDLAIQLLRLQREVEIQNTIYTFLTQQYEEAKIQEAKDTPTLQVLDWASKPEKKHAPRRTIFVIFFSFIGFLLTSIYILYTPAIDDIRSRWSSQDSHRQ